LKREKLALEISGCTNSSKVKFGVKVMLNRVFIATSFWRRSEKM
jgi:hypothetical protein